MQDERKTDAVRAETPGIRWAFAMLFLQIAEVLGLSEVIFSDQKHSGLPHKVGMLEIYYAAVITTVVVQIAGMVLVRRGRYRLGGALQIAASTLHVLKIEGLIGMVGGLRAWKHEGPPPASGAASATPGLEQPMATGS